MVVRGGAMARLVVLCGVLAGLFLMHGSPTAAGGCHSVADRPMAGHRVMAGGAGPQVVAGTSTSHGESAMCVTTQARGGVSLTGPTVSPVAVTAPAVPVGTGVVTGPGDGSRAPPVRGRDLLLQVCVTRT